MELSPPSSPNGQHPRAIYVAALVVVLATNLALAWGAHQRATRAETMSSAAHADATRATTALADTTRVIQQIEETSRSTQNHRAHAEDTLLRVTALAEQANLAAQEADRAARAAREAAGNARLAATRAHNATLRGDVTLGTPTITSGNHFRSTP